MEVASTTTVDVDTDILGNVYMVDNVVVTPAISFMVEYV